MNTAYTLFHRPCDHGFRLSLFALGRNDEILR